MKIAISLLTCDKPELVEQSARPLLEAAIAQKFHLYVIDGSTTDANKKAIWDLTYPAGHMHGNVRGGAGAAIVYALTMMLKHEENYDVVGLVESDVLLRDNWLDCLDLFDRGQGDGLSVGAVSARTYEDRILFQRDGYAVLHNAGAGMVLLTRQAARLVLDNFRTGWTSDNRRIFSQLCGIDIGSYWAFRGSENYLTADWWWDATLAAHGLASLGLTPSPVEMIGQSMTMAEQGLTIATGEVAERWSNNAFQRYVDSLDDIREGLFQVGVDTKFHFNPTNGIFTYFTHQMGMLDGRYEGDWRLKEVRGWGTFAWIAGQNVEFLLGPEPDMGVPAKKFGVKYPHLVVPVFGSCAVLVSGGKTGGKVEVVDEQSGFKASPDLPPEGEQGQVLQLMVPAGMSYRNIRITALTPGCVFYGLQTREKQPYLLSVGFDYSMLPPA